jgi:hypothetical protein
MAPTTNPNIVINRTCGESTGDEIVETSDGQRWLVVRNFDADRATCERRGLLAGDVVTDV